MNKKSILNPMKRIVTVMLAVAMVFSVNLTSMTAHAASINKPTQQTVLSTLPEGVTGVTIGGNEATFYTDDNDSTNTYIRYVYPTDTMLSKLEDLTVVINSSKAVSWDGSDLTTETAGTYTIANVNLLNTAHKLVINNQFVSRIQKVYICNCICSCGFCCKVTSIPGNRFAGIDNYGQIFQLRQHSVSWIYIPNVCIGRIIIIGIEGCLITSDCYPGYAFRQCT